MTETLSRIIPQVILVLLVIAAWMYGRPRRRSWRGSKRLNEREVSRLEKEPVLEKSVTWGGLPLPKEAETSHFAVIGVTGSGKSLTINNFMREAFGGAKHGSDKRVLVYDPKSELASFLPKLDLEIPTVLLSPFDERGAEWNMSADVTGPITSLQVAATFIPEERQGSNRYFSDTARGLLNAVMLAFIASGKQWFLSDVIYATRSDERLEEVVCGTERGAELWAKHSQSEKTLGDILSTLWSRLEPYEPIAALWSQADAKVSIRDWIRGEMVLVLGNDDSARAVVDPLNALLFQRAAELALREPNSKTRRTFFILDELGEAEKLAILPRVLNKGRSKGVSVCISFQDIDTLLEVYGERIARAMLGQCSQKAFLRLASASTAEWASKTVGEFEYVDVLQGQSGGLARPQNRSFSEQWRKSEVVMPSELLSIPWTSAKRGLTGYYLTPFADGVFKRTLPLSHYLKGGLDSKTEIPGVVERQESCQYLGDWTAADRERLGLGHELSVSKQAETEELEQGSVEERKRALSTGNDWDSLSHGATWRRTV
ncbi:MAG: type IV secretion system DNA-binding domain-containing protein [Cyanobacteria bacterium J06648_11]